MDSIAISINTYFMDPKLSVKCVWGTHLTFSTIYPYMKMLKLGNEELFMKNFGQ